MNAFDTQLALALVDEPASTAADYGYEPAPIGRSEAPAHSSDDGLYAIGTILPSQFFDGPQGMDDAGGERGLMLAVLEDAIRSYQDHLHSTRVRSRLQARQAERWIRSEECDWPFSFKNICVSMDIDAELLRSKVLAPRNREERQAPRPSTHRVYRLTPRVKPAGRA